MKKYCTPIVFALCALLAFLATSFEFQAEAADTSSLINKLLPGSEFKNNFDVLLTNMKIRKVPLSKKRSERNLSALYKKERKLTDDLAQIQDDLEKVRYQERRRLRGNDEEEDNGEEANEELDQLSWVEQELSLQLSDVQSKIREAKRIVKDPVNYVSIPYNFGKQPEFERERTMAIILKDRENMHYRAQIVSGQIEPSWMTDEF